jgi:hypothetical protein
MLSPLSLASLWYRVQPQSAMRWELEAGVRGKRASRVLLERHCTEVPPAGEWLNVERPAATRSLLPPTAAAGAAWCVLPSPLAPHECALWTAVAWGVSRVAEGNAHRNRRLLTRTDIRLALPSRGGGVCTGGRAQPLPPRCHRDAAPLTAVHGGGATHRSPLIQERSARVATGPGGMAAYGLVVASEVFRTVDRASWTPHAAGPVESESGGAAEAPSRSPSLRVPHQVPASPPCAPLPRLPAGRCSPLPPIHQEEAEEVETVVMKAAKAVKGQPAWVKMHGSNRRMRLPDARTHAFIQHVLVRSLRPRQMGGEGVQRRTS